MARGRVRKILLLAGTGSFVVGALAWTGLYGLPYAANRVLHENGFPDARAEGVTLTPFGIYIDHISLDSDDFSVVDQVSIGFSWPALLSSSTIDRVSVKSLDLTGEVDSTGHIKIAGWDATRPKSDNSSPLLPVGALLIQGAKIDLDTPEGDIRLEAKLNIDTPEEKDRQNISLSLWGRQKQLSFTLNGNGKIFSNGAYDFSTELLDGRVDTPDFDASRISGTIAVVKKDVDTSPVYSGKIAAGRLKSGNILLQNIDLSFDTSKAEPFSFKTSPSGFPDVVLSGRWASDPTSQLEITVTAKDAADFYKMIAETPDAAVLSYLMPLSPLAIQLALPPSVFENADTKDAAWAVLMGEKKTRLSGVASYKMESGATNITLVPAQIPATDIVPLLPKDFPLVLKSGLVALEGKISVARNEKSVRVTGPLSLSFGMLGGEWNGTLFSALDGKVDISSLQPWAIGKTSLTYNLLGKNGPVGAGGVSFAGQQDKGITVSDAWLDVAGGHVTASPFTLFSPTQPDKTEITLTLDNLEMESLSKIAATDSSFSAKGIINGTIPVTVKNGELSFKGGKISNTGDGSFKYAPDQFPSSLQGDDPRMQTVREALSDFHFSSLSLDLDGPMDGHMTTTLKASGTSPAFGDRPVILNLNLEGDLGRVLQNTLQAGDIGATLRSVQGAGK